MALRINSSALALAALLLGLLARPIPLAAQDALPQSAAAPRAAAAEQRPAPVGAIWVSTAGSHYRNTPRIDLFIEDVVAKPFGEAIIQIVDNQSAFYNSVLLPRAAGIPETFDPLSAMLKGMHGDPRTVKLIAWINPYLAGNINRGEPKPVKHVTVEHPDWLSRRAGGLDADDAGNQYLEPALPEVQQYLESMVREIVRNYPVDGIYFDLMGDPGPDWGFHPAVLEAWRQSGGRGAQDKPEVGDPSWVSFRAEVITQALAGLVKAAKEVRPGIVVGAGAQADGPAPASLEAFRRTPAYAAHHQDWPGWLEGAALGRLYLKDFKSESAEKGAFEGWMQFALKAAAPSGTPVMVGVAGDQNESILAMSQMRKAVEAGAGGIVLSDYEKPVRDVDAKEPFFTAVGSTILSPEYLASVTNRNRLRAYAAKLRAEATTATEGAATKAEAAETSGGFALGMAKPATANGLTSGAESLPLPPPPGAAARRITPADALGGVQVGEGGEVTIRNVRQPRAASAGSSSSLGGAVSATTTRQQLDELLNDPSFTQPGADTLIQIDEKYKAYLKERFGNIFEY